MRYLVTQMENLLLLAIGFVIGWFMVATLPQQVTIGSFPAWLIATAAAVIIFVEPGPTELVAIKICFLLFALAYATPVKAIFCS